MSLSLGDTNGIFPDNHSLGLDLVGLFGALLGIAEGGVLVYAGVVGPAPLLARVGVVVGGVLWAGVFAFLLVAWSLGWLE